MFDKLDFTVEKYNELAEKVADPDIISNQPVWQKHMREMSEMEPIVNKYKEYKKAKEDLEGAKEMLEESSCSQSTLERQFRLGQEKVDWVWIPIRDRLCTTGYATMQNP